ncbi:MAG: hypothetical protein DRR06_20340 [Gammaproteobacteria bacterium]|nr:MAG: hypothetical protein DRR06_20340 [Gammaproteobacteria bacterium]
MIEASKMLDGNLLKVLADAKKVGAVDDSGAMLITDFLKNIEGEIKRKRDQATEIIGEIRALSKLSQVWGGVLRSHTRNEIAAQENRVQAEERRETKIEIKKEVKIKKKGKSKTKKK